jgi:hypothetical protein
MKKKVSFLSVFILVMGLSGIVSAMPIPFKIGTGGSLDTNAVGGAIWTWEALATSEFQLAEGHTSDLIDFFKIWVPAAAATGEITATIDMVTPDPTVSPADTGNFWILKFGIGVGGLSWGGPEQFEYSYMGMDGGLLTLNLKDIPDWTIFCSEEPILIQGYISNDKSPAPVPEPSTILLMGTGLFGLAAYSRKRFYKKV